MKNMTKLVTLLLTLNLFLGGCSGTTTGNPLRVSLNFSSYNSVAAWTPFDIFMSKSHAAINNLTFCFKRVRFKLADTDTTNPADSEDNIDFDIGEVTIDSAGTFLGTIEVPAGNYKRVEFDLEDKCSSNKSVTLNNDNGNYSTNDRITIKFKGTLNLTSDQDVTLDIQSIIDAANGYNGTGDLKDTLEDATGSL